MKNKVGGLWGQTSAELWTPLVRWLQMCPTAAVVRPNSVPARRWEADRPPNHFMNLRRAACRVFLPARATNACATLLCLARMAWSASCEAPDSISCSNQRWEHCNRAQTDFPECLTTQAGDQGHGGARQFVRLSCQHLPLVHEAQRASVINVPFLQQQVVKSLSSSENVPCLHRRAVLRQACVS